MEEKKYDIFISYSRKDFEGVNSFVEMLKSDIPTLTYWFDITGIESADEFQTKIITAINKSSYVLFFLSNNSVVSSWTKKEVMFAKNKNKKVIPILLYGIDLKHLNNDWFSFEFGLIDCIDSTNDLQVKKLLNNLSEWTNNEIVSEENIKISTSKPRQGLLFVISRHKKLLLVLFPTVFLCLIFLFNRNNDYTVIEVNKNDSLYMTQVREAIGIISELGNEDSTLKIVKTTTNIDTLKVANRKIDNLTVSELCRAATIYKKASNLQASHEVKEKGEVMWSESQMLIDKTYIFLLRIKNVYSVYGITDIVHACEQNENKLTEFITPNLKTNNN